MTPSPVTRGLGERGLLQLEAGRDGERRKVGGCCYPKSNWPETSCAVPANFHNDRISPFPLSHTHTRKERAIHRHSLLLADDGCCISFRISSSFLFPLHSEKPFGRLLSQRMEIEVQLCTSNYKTGLKSFGYVRSGFESPTSHHCFLSFSFPAFLLVCMAAHKS